MKIGTEAWMIEARPESIRVSPHDSSQNGTAVLTSPTTTSGTPVGPQLRDHRASAERDTDDDGERERRKREPAEDERGRVELSDARP